MHENTIKVSFYKRKKIILNNLLIISIAILSVSFQSMNRKTASINKFVLAIIDNDNEKVLHKFFKSVNDPEVKGYIFDFFEALRTTFNSLEKKEINVNKLNKATYEIEMGNIKYPILIYRNCCRLKIKSVTPLKKGDIITGWVQANVKFKDEKSE